MNVSKLKLSLNNKFYRNKLIAVEKAKAAKNRDKYVKQLNEMRIYYQVLSDGLSKNLKLSRENRIRSIHSSLAIEQNSLSVAQVSDIINGKLILGSPQDIKEVKNAYELLAKLNPYSIEDLLKAHKVMMSDLIGELFTWMKDTKLHLLIKSCIFHYEFEFIHPFADGNGRIGRLWHTLISAK